MSDSFRLALWAVNLGRGATGLDDWLDQPQRRRGAHLLLLIVTVFLAPALAVADRDTELVALAVATVLSTFALLVATSWTWKRLGVLRFKKVLVAVALLAFAAPVTLTPREPDFAPGASPLGEGAVPPPWPEVWRQLQEHPTWHFAGVAATLLAAGIWALASRLRRR